MNTLPIEQLKQIALSVRERIIKMATKGGCFLGASLSAVDILTYLYTQFLDISKDKLQDFKRDYLLLSKGHDVPALYGLFVEMNWLEENRLNNHLSTTDSIYWHPNRQIPGVEFHSGSLGQLPAVALGIALDMQMRNLNQKVICVMGDGELNEGSCWEAFLVANAKKLDNLYFVIDRNHFQANMPTEELIPLEPLEDKFKAFGLQVIRIDGHNFEQLDVAFKASAQWAGPKVIICDTIRGKGLPSIESRADRWFCNFSDREIDELLAELHQQKLADLTAETIVAR